MENQNEENQNYLSSEKLIALRQALLGIKVNVDKAISVLSRGEEEDISSAALEESLEKLREMNIEEGGNGRIVEGVFDGENMVGPDGKQYSIPANYASKSKLVEGDILKLTIAPNGSFIYKQIGPIERNRLIGVLGKNESEEDYLVYVKDKKWKVLTASVTYFKGEIGDEVVILVTKDRPSKWAAIENIIKKKE
jgi:hypothetical protein